MRVALVLSLLLLLPAVASAEWRAFHHDERNTGYQSGTEYQVYEDVWWSQKISPATQVESSPVVANGLVAIGDWAGTLRVLDASTGAEKWRATMAKIVGTPAISSNKLFVVDTAGLLNAYRLETGVVLGTVSVGPTLASPAIHEGKIFIGNEAGEMKAYDTETLTLLWKFSVNSISEWQGPSNTTAACPTSQYPVIPAGQIRGAPAVYQGKVIFGSMNHWVYAINEQGEPGQTTLPQWIFKTGDIVVSSPSIDHTTGRVIIGSYDEKVYSLSASPGAAGPYRGSGGVCSAYKNAATWTYSVPSTIGLSKVHSTPATDGTRIYFGANNGHIYAIWPTNGTMAWDFTTEDVALSSPAVSNGIVVAGSDDGNLYWINATTGLKIKSFLVGSAIKANPALDGNKTFAVSFDGDIHMFGPAIPAQPDLSITSVLYEARRVHIFVRNDGDAPAVASVLRLTIDGILAADLAVPALQPGESTELTHRVTLEAGSHPLAATADQNGVVAESDETNNAGTGIATIEGEAKKGDKGGIPAPGLSMACIAFALAGLARRRLT